MMLSDREIRTLIQGKEIGYTPFDEKFVNPASVDMTLSPMVRLPNYLTDWIDVADVQPDHTELHEMDAEGGLRLDPGDFILACTNESVELPDDIVARVEGKSSIGRLGLAVHITAGFIDPGFAGQITLEVANLAPWAITLRPNMRIAQIAFQRMSEPAHDPYGGVGHYQGQNGPTESRYRLS